MEPTQIREDISTFRTLVQELGITIRTPSGQKRREEGQIIEEMIAVEKKFETGVKYCKYISLIMWINY
jgi:hypothetical protein